MARRVDFLSVRNALAFGDEGSFQPRHWLASQRLLPRQAPFFLRPAFVKEALAYSGISTEFRPAILRTAAAVAKSTELSRLAWHGHYVFFLSPESPKISGRWTGLSHALGRLAHLFPAVLLLSGLPLLRQKYARLGLPGSVLHATLSDIEIWLRDHQATLGGPGLVTLPWLMHHFRARLFRLGRLQFMVKKFDGSVVMLKERSTGKAVIMSLAGIHYRRDGQCDGSNHTYEDPKRAWVSTFRRHESYLEGHLISEAGAAQRRLVRLPRSRWKVVLRPGDAVLDIHIPAGEPMRLSACQASLAEADAFFSRYFPGQALRGKMCWSWLLDPTFKTMLPSASNIRAFQSLFHIYPVPCSDEDIFHRIFPAARYSRARLPRDNSLRRAILEFLDKGGNFFGAGGGIVREAEQ